MLIRVETCDAFFPLLEFFSFRGGDLISHHINATAGSPLPFLSPLSSPPPYGSLIAAKAIPNILAREQLTKKHQKKSPQNMGKSLHACACGLISKRLPLICSFPLQQETAIFQPSTWSWRAQAQHHCTAISNFM